MKTPEDLDKRLHVFYNTPAEPDRSVFRSRRHADIAYQHFLELKLEQAKAVLDDVLKLNTVTLEGKVFFHSAKKSEKTKVLHALQFIRFISVVADYKGELTAEPREYPKNFDGISVLKKFVAKATSGNHLKKYLKIEVTTGN